MCLRCGGEDEDGDGENGWMVVDGCVEEGITILLFGRCVEL